MLFLATFSYIFFFVNICLANLATVLLFFSFGKWAASYSYCLLFFYFSTCSAGFSLCSSGLSFLARLLLILAFSFCQNGSVDWMSPPLLKTCCSFKWTCCFKGLMLFSCFSTADGGELQIYYFFSINLPPETWRWIIVHALIVSFQSLSKLFFCHSMSSRLKLTVRLPRDPWTVGSALWRTLGCFSSQQICCREKRSWWTPKFTSSPWGWLRPSLSRGSCRF